MDGSRRPWQERKRTGSGGPVTLAVQLSPLKAASKGPCVYRTIGDGKQSQESKSYEHEKRIRNTPELKPMDVRPTVLLTLNAIPSRLAHQRHLMLSPIDKTAMRNLEDSRFGESSSSAFSSTSTGSDHAESKYDSDTSMDDIELNRGRMTPLVI